MSTAVQHAPLGFGLMRLPQAGEQIDIEQTSRMVDAFLEAGFTYFDTAYVYNGSEDAARRALVERHPRDRYTLATQHSAWWSRGGGPGDGACPGPCGRRPSWRR